jgi:molecular chaperone GrpE
MPRKENEIVVVSQKELDEKDELINALEAKSEKMKSDFSRYKKRIEDKEEVIQRKAYGELARRLLSVADTLERAIESQGVDGGGCEVLEKMQEGTRSNLGMTYNQLLTALGVTPIVPLPGERFNDELHTAIETTSNSFLPDKAVVSLVRKGYMLNDELIRPAEVVISRGGELKEEKEEPKTEAKPETISSRVFRRLESKVFKRKFSELEEREQELGLKEQELSQNEEMLRNSVRELEAREAEFNARIEGWSKQKDADESKVHELEQRRETLNDELEGLKRQLSAIHTNLNDLDAKKDKIVVENIALGRYNEELLADKANLLNEMEELEIRRESVNTELIELEERKTKSSEELLNLEEELRNSRESVNAELIELEERRAKTAEELFKITEELKKTQELFHAELKEKEKEKEKEEREEKEEESKAFSFVELEMP